MPKTAVAKMPAKLYALLSPLSAEERARAIQATLILFGDDTQGLATVPIPARVPHGTGHGAAVGVNRPLAGTGDASSFFDEKSPKNKGEVLAVAARFRELYQQQEHHSKSDLKAVITGARRNFDDGNFARDINNAKRQAGFFNLGTGRNALKLSYYGQQFVDALPDRDAASKINRPKVGGNRKKASAKAGD